jgi:hypothetical protein
MSRNDRTTQQIFPVGTVAFGTGLTRHARAKYDLMECAVAAAGSTEIAQELATLLRKAYPTPIERVEDLHEWAVSLLRRYGMPDRAGLVVVEDDGSWRWVDPAGIVNESQSVESRTLMSAMAFAQREEESPPWFAATALELISAFREAVSRNPGSAAVEIAWQLGTLAERYRWKMSHEQAAEDGYRMREGRKKGAAPGSAATKEAGDLRFEAVIAATRKAWAIDPSLVGHFAKTARVLAGDPRTYFELDHPPLSVERLRKRISQAHQRGLLK